ncbi:imidazolonepropionase [Roseateles amylovorans]|uniref:Imidazolonepropionase n=1 Tax=Roseateles amylovorans TaxID=2978473 RepID=A0ABY6B5G8_9BURK|nr:imidazolonepropionase [Roseateles amylovorans]UXH79553.1 imidazolonepropionase [Roseateles amylovorans]
MSERRLWTGAHLVTFAGDRDWGLVPDGALLTEGEALRWVGPRAALPRALCEGLADEQDLGGALVTPGLIDAHTHLVYGGERSAEFELRLQGASYEEIARAGGGIRSTVAATRQASESALHTLALARAQALMAEGLTTLEIKSGYGLSLDDEAKCLRVARRLGEAGLTVRTTFLGAHAVPPEFDGRQDDYVEAVCQWMPILRDQGLIDAVDAFCERIAFTPAQTRRVFETARGLGLPVKLHAEQLSDQGGAALAAGFGALSCDHLEHLSDDGIRAMADAGTVALLLPGAYYFLRETQLPPIAALRAAGVPIALATDHNPGSAPGLSLLLMLNMACTLFRLTPEEALRGLTVNAARALGLADRGRLVAGQRADFCIWNAAHPRELSYYFGRNPIRGTVMGGRTRA